MVPKKAPKSTDKHVGSRVRMRRLELGISQATLAQGLGLTFQQVQKYETGTNRISASRLQQAAHILKVPVTFFFDGTEPLSAAKDRPLNELVYFMATQEGLALAKSFMRIGDIHLRRRIVDLVKQIDKAKR
jgi:transcriptional regulator with XRE-family HTH domain